MSLNEDHCGECEKDPCVCVEQDDEDDVSPSQNKAWGKRTLIDMVDDEDDPHIYQSAAGKTPAHMRRFIDDECEEEVEEPDLQYYFEQYELTKQQQIAMCRTYANYLAQQLRSSGKMKAARTHKK